jgi:hypothetical protein
VHDSEIDSETDNETDSGIHTDIPGDVGNARDGLTATAAGRC